MKTKLLATQGKGYFYETEYDCPETFDNGIIIKNIMTGVCTSDIAMMQGNFGPLPLHMQGHEGLGKVISVGSDVRTEVKVGDYVATRGEPAYADYYPVREGEFVVVPEAHPRYIIEPVACGINIVEGDLSEIINRSVANYNARLLIIGSGFLAYVAYQTLKLHEAEYHIDVVGRSNKDMWLQDQVELKSWPGTDYDIVIVLNDNHSFLELPVLVKENGLVIDAVGRSISKKESENLLWRAVTTSRPSPRRPFFLDCMEQGVAWIESGKLKVDKFWSRSYNRTTEWQDAFQDGMNRPPGYSRGYIVW
jgi:D-arabinose 1-dehydrogenase-like Zn-dependent alcohol dehydrogenase